MSISPARPASVAGTPLRELATLLGLPAPDTGTVVTGATLRAHEVLPGDVFAALPGARTHGARYADRAVEAGAVAVLTDPDGAALLAAAAADVPALVVADPRSALGPLAARIYGDPSTALTMIGVTGTSGKTTSCFLVEAALAAQGLTTGLIGTVMTRIAGPAGSQELPSAFTTPEAPDLQALLAVMRERGVQAVTMEVSSHALALGRVGGTRFRVGAFTNLSQDHLDFHPDMEDYFEAKAALFDGRSDAGVVVVDDEWGRRLAARHPDAVTVSAVLPADRADGADRAAHWQLTALDTDATGRQRLRIAGPDGLQLDTGLALPGRYNVANAMTAIAAVAAAGFDPQRAADAVATVQVPGRMQRVDAGQDFLAVVDYAHKPAAVAAVLDAVRAAVPGRVVVVLGAGGDRDTGKRALMGAAAAARADTVIVTDDNPRSEDPAAIRAAVLAGAHGERRHRRAERIEEVGDRRAAIAAAVAQARPGDAVVIAGKGHEKGQQVGEVVHPFSDEQELRAALQRAGRQGVAR